MQLKTYVFTCTALRNFNANNTDKSSVCGWKNSVKYSWNGSHTRCLWNEWLFEGDLYCESTPKMWYAVCIYLQLMNMNGLVLHCVYAECLVKITHKQKNYNGWNTQRKIFWEKPNKHGIGNLGIPLNWIIYIHIHPANFR